MVGKITLLINMNTLENINDKATILEKNVDKVTVYYESFLEVYNNLKLLSNISTRIPISLVVKLNNIIDDFMFLSAINHSQKYSSRIY